MTLMIHVPFLRRTSQSSVSLYSCMFWVCVPERCGLSSKLEVQAGLWHVKEKEETVELLEAPMDHATFCEGQDHVSARDNMDVFGQGCEVLDVFMKSFSWPLN